MKKILLVLTLFLTFIAGISAQDLSEEGPAKRDRRFREVQEFKMKYLAQEMELSEDQKQKFFEVYEEMNKSRQECYSEAVRLDRELKHDKDADETSYQQVTEAFNKANAEWAETEKVYNEKFSEFLTQKQIYKMKEAENNFRAKLDEMRHSRKKDHHKKDSR